MGLLDILGSDTGLLGLNLMAAGSARPVRTGFGEGLLGALQSVQAQRAAEEDRKAKQQMQQMQVQQLQEAAAARKQAQEQQQQRMSYLGAIDAEQGPAMPLSVPRALSAGLSLPEIGALQPQGARAPEFKVVGGRLVRIQGDDVREAYAAPEKPDLNSLIIPGPDGKPMLNKALFDAKQQLARAGATNVGLTTYGSPVAAQDAQGLPVFVQPTKDGSPAMVMQGIRPPKTAAEERAEAEQGTRARQGQQMNEALTAAEKILKGGKATASGIGNVMDAGARAVGITTTGAQDSARLQALSGWLVANVPRMEGPQSNFDVQNYTTMAGKIGDPTVPIAERLAALGTVRTLQQRYAAINGAPISGGATVVRTGRDAQGRKVEQMSDGSIRYGKD
jgi:hypothetical protein